MTTQTNRRAAAATLTASAALFAIALNAQQPQALSFEVTSVKPNRTGDRSSRFQLLPGGRFVATNTTVLALLQSAYQFEYMPFQITGGPSWLGMERFDVEGRAPMPTPSRAEVDAMVRSLLATRFKVVYGKETRDMPVYQLVVARVDGRMPPQFRPASKPCDRTPIAVNPPAPDPNALPRCGARSARGTLAPDNQRIEGVGATLDDLAQRLAAPARRIVVNRTNLQGFFDYEVEFTPDNNQAGADTPDTGLALFTALQEQLGLRLESARGPVDMLVIQSAEKPDAD
jgi:uncharacterized protein (TIGR03435 family)